jgi:hypothetical protein
MRLRKQVKLLNEVVTNLTKQIAELETQFTEEIYQKKVSSLYDTFFHNYERRESSPTLLGRVRQIEKQLNLKTEVTRATGQKLKTVVEKKK